MRIIRSSNIYKEAAARAVNRFFNAECKCGSDSFDLNISGAICCKTCGNELDISAITTIPISMIGKIALAEEAGMTSDQIASLLTTHIDIRKGESNSHFMTYVETLGIECGMHLHKDANKIMHSNTSHINYYKNFAYRILHDAYNIRCPKCDSTEYSPAEKTRKGKVVCNKCKCKFKRLQETPLNGSYFPIWKFGKYLNAVMNAYPFSPGSNVEWASKLNVAKMSIGKLAVLCREVMAKYKEPKSFPTSNTIKPKPKTSARQCKERFTAESIARRISFLEETSRRFKITCTNCANTKFHYAHKGKGAEIRCTKCRTRKNLIKDTPLNGISIPIEKLSSMIDAVLTLNKEDLVTYYSQFKSDREICALTTLYEIGMIPIQVQKPSSNWENMYNKLVKLNSKRPFTAVRRGPLHAWLVKQSAFVICGKPLNQEEEGRIKLLIDRGLSVPEDEQIGLEVAENKQCKLLGIEKRTDLLSNRIYKFECHQGHQFEILGVKLWGRYKHSMSRSIPLCSHCNKATLSSRFTNNYGGKYAKDHSERQSEDHYAA
jgi:hypothetical protein